MPERCAQSRVSRLAEFEQPAVPRPPPSAAKRLTRTTPMLIHSSAGSQRLVATLTAHGARFRHRLPLYHKPEYSAGCRFHLPKKIWISRAVADELQKIKLDRHEAVIGSSQLPKSAGVLIRMLAADGSALKRAMLMVWCAARFSLKGSLPAARRK